jgi:AraC-like DNA-binding protein
MAKNRSQVITHPVLPGLIGLDAEFGDQQFPRHWHETYSVGVILSGVNRFQYRGASHYASADMLCVMSPGELHTGETCTEAGWAYFNIYPSEEMMAAAQRSLDLAPASAHFRTPVLSDPSAAVALRRLSVAMRGGGSALEIEQCWLAFCDVLFARHVERPREQGEGLAIPRQVALAREVLDSTFADSLSLTELAELCGVSPYHLARSFAAHVGLPPHAYQLQRKIEHARSLILAGLDLADAAAAAGFADQAHMTRHFRRHLGATPGQFSPHRKNVQYPG